MVTVLLRLHPAALAGDGTRFLEMALRGQHPLRPLTLFKGLSFASWYEVQAAAKIPQVRWWRIECARIEDYA